MPNDKPRCPKCHRPGIQQGEDYYCRQCGMFFDDDPSEGGDYSHNPSVRMERQERRRTEHAKRRRRL